jgi:Lrp/AsnC family leucine-responsive transcriptional regulator
VRSEHHLGAAVTGRVRVRALDACDAHIVRIDAPRRTAASARRTRSPCGSCRARPIWRRYARRIGQPEPLDEIDRSILDRLRVNARERSEAIGKHVNLTASAVRRRIARLEQRRVISGYTVAIDHDRLGSSSIEAYIELSFVGNADVHAILQDAIGRPEVREAMTIAGDTDALLRVRVGDLAQLRQVITELRTSGPVTGSKTRIVLGRWWHGSVPQPAETTDDS